MGNEKIAISFPDGNVKYFPKGVTLNNIAESISPSLKKNAVAGKVNERLCDLSHCIMEDSSISIITKESEEGLAIVRHTTSHILGQAVKRLYDNAKLGIGPVIEHGFYYDFKLAKPLTPTDLIAIEKEMEAIIKEGLEIERIEVTHKEAAEIFRERDEVFKLQLLNDIPLDEVITLYKQGEFIDLCRGPHLQSTGAIKSFKITSFSGAYWRGDSQNEVMQRIYGVAFLNKKDLNQHLFLLEEAEKRDHRKLGKELDLFMFSTEAPGMPFYLPKGQTLRTELENYSREIQVKAGYEEVRTPSMMNQRLWEKSGHWDHYHENMYFSEVDNAKFAMKPMNCPGHMLIFKNKLHSYRDLPIRIAEFGQVHRHEFSGALNGLLRVRTFCQDDAHIFVRNDQIESEIKEVFRLVDVVYRTFGFNYSVELSTRPEQSLGSEELWRDSEDALRNVLEELDINYQLNEGDGAFYGPKIDFHIKDAIGRSHQCATIQLDFQMPEKFDLSYVNEKAERVRPVVIHRAVFGSIDRFIGILIEHFAGVFPVWLAPIQVQIVPISKVHLDYALNVQSALKSVGIRVEVDARVEKVGYRIRESQIQKVPYTLILGDKEVQDETVNVRKLGCRKTKDLSIKDFKVLIQQEIEQRVL